MQKGIAKRVLLFSVGAVPVVCAGENVSAQLFATFSLNQALYESGSPFFTSVQDTPFTDTSLPLQQTVSQTTATNGITATYSAYDHGTAAGFSISSSGYTTAAGNAVEEGTGSGIVPNDNSDTTFSFSQEVSYIISYQITGTTPTGDLELRYPYQYTINDPELFPSFSQSGTLQPNVLYDLTETWAIGNENNNNPADLSGTDAISLTFTAIPEPASLSLMLLPLALLRRRRVRARHG